jgi:SHS2 domain-containing protein
MYELTEHQSEIGIYASHDTIEGAFCEASKALFSIMTDIESVEQIESSNILVNADNLEELFAELLNELIFMMNINSTFYSRFIYSIEKENEKYMLTGTVQGEAINSDKHELRTEPKAATYSGLKVWEENSKHHVTIIIDV